MVTTRTFDSLRKFVVLRIVTEAKFRAMSTGAATSPREAAGMEKRRAVRYRLAARVAFSWEGSGDNLLKGEGITRDLGRRGAFIFSATCPPVDCPVRLNILLPPLVKGAAGTRIGTQGNVLRIEHADATEGPSGFAVITEAFMLYEGGETSS
jgi:hypothetical protein